MSKRVKEDLDSTFESDNKKKKTQKDDSSEEEQDEPRRRKTLSASIEPGQIGDIEDLDPLTLFWIDEQLTAKYDYGDVETCKNPKIKDETFKFVSNLIEKYKSLDRETISFQQYRVLNDSLREYTNGIGDVYDFEYKEKNLYYVKGDTFHYCAMVCGFKDIVICGEAAQPREIFYWTPQCYFRTGGENEEEDEEEYDVSHVKPLKKLKDVTFDNVLDNIKEFFDQFL